MIEVTITVSSPTSTSVITERVDSSGQGAINVATEKARLRASAVARADVSGAGATASNAVPRLLGS